MSSHAVPDPVPPAQIAPRTGAPAEEQMRGLVGERARVRDIACDLAMRWLWDYVDARLPDAPRVVLEAHLATCAACPTHVAFARAMRRALADAPDPVAGAARDPDAPHAELRARVQRALAEARVEVTPHGGDPAWGARP